MEEDKSKLGKANSSRRKIRCSVSGHEEQGNVLNVNVDVNRTTASAEVQSVRREEEEENREGKEGEKREDETSKRRRRGRRRRNGSLGGVTAGIRGRYNRWTRRECVCVYV